MIIDLEQRAMWEAFQRARRPLPPEVLAGALQDRVHVEAPRTSLSDAARETLRRLEAMAQRIGMHPVDYAWLTDGLIAALAGERGYADGK